MEIVALADRRSETTNAASGPPELAANLEEAQHRSTATPQHRPGLLRLGYLALGLLCVALGWIGVLVPGMPSTIFFIIALWAFQKSSPRLENWLLLNRLIGPTLRDWRENRSISRRTKIVAIVTIWACIGVSVYFVRSPWAIGVLLATALTLTWFLWSRKAKH